MEEIWKEIVLDRETKYKYQVSNYGRVKRIFEGSVDSRGRIFPYKEEFVAINFNKKNGYYNVCIASKKYYLHRIVAEYFCEGYSKDLEVNHINGDKSDNRAKNLEWVTKKENMEHASRANLINRDSEKRKTQCKKNQKKAIDKHYKKVVQLTNNGEYLNTYNSIKEASEKTGIDDGSISRSTKTKYLAGGFKWILFTDYIKN